MSRRDTRELDQNAALEAYRAAACAEADAHFDDRALESQRHKILAKLALRFERPRGFERQHEVVGIGRLPFRGVRSAGERLAANLCDHRSRPF